MRPTAAWICVGSQLLSRHLRHSIRRDWCNATHFFRDLEYDERHITTPNAGRMQLPERHTDRPENEYQRRKSTSAPTPQPPSRARASPPPYIVIPQFRRSMPDILDNEPYTTNDTQSCNPKTARYDTITAFHRHTARFSLRGLRTSSTGVQR